ncbi:MAG: lipopolysaccharide biosynthesis protein [Deltaproteobacteria bacterium]|nr:lipopolysaccharide biosynthesis protein [Deltaproteobacteria bacterium]MBI3294142.1 lipopolysaccharide biosynthesis protein [Deltaproteobacteria bacterium]
MRKRYAFKLVSNVLSGLCNTVTQLVVPRVLGPGQYGNFSFVTNFFGQVGSLLDAGSSTALCTKIAQRSKESGLVRFYSYIASFLLLAQGLFILVVGLTPWSGWVWPEQNLSIVVMGFGWAFLTWLTTTVINMADALGLTVSSEKARVWNKLIGLGGLLVLAQFHLLSLAGYFGLTYVIFLGLLAQLFVIIRRSGLLGDQIREPISSSQRRAYWGEFFRFSRPLFVFMVVSSLANVFERNLLQQFGGSIEQGYFGFAMQLSNLSLLFTQAMVPLIHREFSMGSAEGDRAKLVRLYRTYVPPLYALSAAFCGFVAIYSREVCLLMGGAKYGGGASCLFFMGLFPICATFGQLSSALFYASNRTDIFQRMALFSLIVGVPMAYFLLAPGDRGGLGLGAEGLAIKMLSFQTILMVFQLYCTTELLGLSFAKHLSHAMASVLIFLGFAFLSHWAVKHLAMTSHLLVVLCGGGLYGLIAWFSLFATPQLFGIHRQDFHSLIQRARDRLSY